ncbi:hypothetical protein CEXT_316421 [Caerostris extrusa]|uniref:Uncharacterized protein n=1 Tax=Caerostris extrusa TaxID=172846 RepID=A0AAV4VKX4_CAEEX|nr:hypothetical protein CEXT_316421 [Caerostris extrusa]
MPPSSREIKGTIKKQCATASRVYAEATAFHQKKTRSNVLANKHASWVIISFRTLASRVSLVNGGIEKARRPSLLTWGGKGRLSSKNAVTSLNNHFVRKRIPFFFLILLLFGNCN